MGSDGLSNEIIFARLVTPSEDSSDAEDAAPLGGRAAWEQGHPVMAELISRGLLDDDHMSAAQIEGLVRRTLLQREVAREQQRQRIYEQETASFVVEPTVLSDCNMTNFTEMAQRVDPLRALTWIRHCHVMEHQMDTTSLAALIGGPVHHMTPQVRLADGNLIPLVVTECHDRECERCTTGRGGYRFQWRGPWTCEVAHVTPDGDGRRRWMACRNTRGCAACRRVQDAEHPDDGIDEAVI
jgi:hypothetical protein